MKNLIQNSVRSLTAGLCLLCSLLAYHAGATVIYWDPEGTYPVPPYYSGDLSGTWENSSWSTASGGQATGIAWPETYDAACFAVGSGLGTPPFTITINNQHTMAGIFVGGLAPNACDATFSGTGSFYLDYPGGTPAHACAFAVTSSSDGALAYIRVAVPLTGPGLVYAEGNGQLFLNTNNTYTGGTVLGYSGFAFNGIYNFNNPGAFGTGGILVSNSTGALAIDPSISTAMTVTNAWNIGADRPGCEPCGQPEWSDLQRPVEF